MTILIYKTNYSGAGTLRRKNSWKKLIKKDNVILCSHKNYLKKKYKQSKRNSPEKD